MLNFQFAKAFDSVPHSRGRDLLSWFDYFLTRHFQIGVVVNGTCSEWLPVRSGVPQGSCSLGPFVVYDIHHPVSHSSTQLFTDDVALYKEIVTESDSALLQADLNSAYMIGPIDGYSI